MFVGLKRVCACPVLLIDWLTTDLKEKSLPQVFCERECGAFSVVGSRADSAYTRPQSWGLRKGCGGQGSGPPSWSQHGTQNPEIRGRTRGDPPR